MKHSSIIFAPLITCLVVGAFLFLRWSSSQCPDWALRHVQGLYIDLADGKMDTFSNATFSGSMKKAFDEIPNEKCRVDYTSFASNTILKSPEEVRALAAAFLRRWGGAEYQP